MEWVAGGGPGGEGWALPRTALVRRPHLVLEAQSALTGLGGQVIVRMLVGAPVASGVKVAADRSRRVAEIRTRSMGVLLFGRIPGGRCPVVRLSVWAPAEARGGLIATVASNDPPGEWGRQGGRFLLMVGA